MIHPRPDQKTQDAVLVVKDLFVSGLHFSIKFLGVFYADLTFFVVKFTDK